MQVTRAVLADIKEGDWTAWQLDNIQLQIYVALPLSNMLYQERLYRSP